MRCAFAAVLFVLASGSAHAQLTVVAPGLNPSTPAGPVPTPCDDRGEVSVSLQVDASGRAQWVMIEFENPVGCGWAQVARQIVETRRYKPYRVNGVAMDSPFLRFRLRIEPAGAPAGTRLAGQVESKLSNRVMTLLPVE
jgi:hypothetical protein